MGDIHGPLDRTLVLAKNLSAFVAHVQIYSYSPFGFDFEPRLRVTDCGRYPDHDTHFHFSRFVNLRDIALRKSSECDGLDWWLTVINCLPDLLRDERHHRV